MLVENISAECPTRYRTRLFFNNLQRNLIRTTDTYLFISHTTNVLLFKFRWNIFIGVRIIKEMTGLVESGTLCIKQKIKRPQWATYILDRLLH